MSTETLSNIVRADPARVELFDYDERGDRSQGVRIGRVCLYFSYKTVIGFSDGLTTYTRVNEWGPTTGHHLKSIDRGNKQDRLPSDVFEAKLSETLQKYGLSV